MPDWLPQWLATGALSVASVLAGAFWRLHMRQNADSVRLAVLEQSNDLSHIRDDIKAMREHLDVQGVRIFDKMENVRLELKADIAAKADK
jgi:hypothetical protein